MVTPVFDAKYLTNGFRYGHGYYRIIEGEWETASKLANGTNFNDIE